MNLAWHIAQKDLRRMAWPVALWCAFILIGAIWFRLAGPGEVRGEAGITEWMTLTRDFTWIILGAQWIVGYVLAGALVLEDPVVGENGFWRTRPIGAGRLCTAKLLAAMLLFVAAPLLLLAPVWLSSGFTIGDVGRASVAFAGKQIPLTLSALAIASISRELAGFLFCSVGLAIAQLASGFVGAWLSPRITAGLNSSREIVAIGGLCWVALFILVQQFLTRRTERAWLTLIVALVAGTAVHIAWPWDFSATRGQREEQPADRAAQIDVAYSPQHEDEKEVWPPHVTVMAPWTKESFYAPVSARSAENNRAFGFSAGWDVAGRRALGFDTGETPIKWRLALVRFDRREKDPTRLDGELDVWLARARIVGEMPVQLGAQLADSANRTQIVGLARQDDRLDGIYLSEHKAASAPPNNVIDQPWPEARDGEREAEQYYLVDRAAHRAQPARASEMGLVDLNGLRVGVRRLSVSGEGDWWHAVLVKVRFERDHEFSRPFTTSGAAVEGKARP